MSDVLKWLQNMANEEWEYEDGDYALEAIKFFNSLRAENEKLRRLVERIVEHHEHDESEVSGWTQWEALVKDARAALEGVTKKSGAGNE